MSLDWHKELKRLRFSSLTSALLCVRIVHMILMVNHRMKSMIAIRVIREIVFGMFHKVRVASGNDVAGEHAVNDGAEHVAAMITYQFASVNVWCVHIDRTTWCVNLFKGFIFLIKNRVVLANLNVVLHTTKSSLNVCRSLFKRMWNGRLCAQNLRLTCGSRVTDLRTRRWLSCMCLVS